ncbi:hypothetical protein [Candidatus Regiella endosymbiont of Tuberolachnus salignus]|uniref:hypothetical protein n=1 Tax=Candidatus Regiella endosymbiont of Tuberolachnus salignus TaxID=3077956 RepID=UPI0030D28280
MKKINIFLKNHPSYLFPILLFSCSTLAYQKNEQICQFQWGRLFLTETCTKKNSDEQQILPSPPQYQTSEYTPQGRRMGKLRPLPPQLVK